MNKVNKIKSFIQLDFLTIKPYFTLKNVSIYAVIVLILSMFSGNIASGMGVGMMLGTMYISYPFAVGEKSNMDALYAVLSISRKTAVLARYLYSLITNCFTIIFFYIISAAGLLVSMMTGNEVDLRISAATVFILAVLMAVVEAFQLPAFFKHGYSKAKFISVVPFAIIAAGIFMITVIERFGLIDSASEDNIINFIMSIPHGYIIAAACLLIFAVLYGSYRLSLKYYSKREF
ncbi:MAG: ABC-2 transporter permease [Treponema sp.]|nr:ABC-2 transporter permease [Treponema sp.]